MFRCESKIILEGKQIVSKFDGNKLSVSDMGRKNILKAHYALKMIVFVEKKTCRDNTKR